MSDKETKGKMKKRKEEKVGRNEFIKEGGKDRNIDGWRKEFKEI